MLAFGLTAAWACSTAYSTDADAPDAGTDATLVPDQSSTSQPVTNDPDADQPPPSEAGADVVTPASCNKPCDCDGDGYTVRDAGCEDAGTKYTDPPPDSGVPPKPLYDCDDTDPTTHPLAEFQTRVPVPPQTGDWDCSGSVQKQFDAPVTCTPIANIFCTGGTGFNGPVACGGTGTLVTCTGQTVGQTFTCTPIPTGTQNVEGCR